MLDRILAAMMFFTRIPFGRICKVKTEAFRHVPKYWPFAGWITGGIMSLAFCLSITVFTPLSAAVIAVIVRMLVTGALHEDGLADFCDGMGGGTTREQTLNIMKDSRIGAYGVLGLIAYLLLLVSLIASLPTDIAPLIIFTNDIFAKAVAACLLYKLPYARTNRQAKSGIVYKPWNSTTMLTHLARTLVALIPAGIWMLSCGSTFPYATLIVPCIVLVILAYWMYRRIGGYTGDCFGATLLLCELSLYSAVVIYFKIPEM